MMKENNEIFYDTIEAMKCIKHRYPYIPIFIIRRILYAEELYMYSIGIMKIKPDLESWYYKK